MSFRKLIGKLIETITNINNGYSLGALLIVVLFMGAYNLWGNDELTLEGILVLCILVIGGLAILRFVLGQGTSDEPTERLTKLELKGKKIVFSGTLEQDRVTHKSNAEKWGATVSENVTRQTDFLIVGTRPGETKLRSAREYNIRQIGEEEWIEMTRSLR